MTRREAVLKEVSDTARNDCWRARLGTGDAGQVLLVTAHRVELIGCAVHCGVSLVCSYVSLGRKDTNKRLDFMGYMTIVSMRNRGSSSPVSYYLLAMLCLVLISNCREASSP